MENMNNELPVGKKEEKIIIKLIDEERNIRYTTSLNTISCYRVIVLVNKHYLVSLGKCVSIDCTEIPRLSEELIPEDYIPIRTDFIYYQDILDKEKEYISLNKFSRKLSKRAFDEITQFINKNIVLGERGQTEFSRHKFIHQEPDTKNQSAFMKFLEDMFTYIFGIPLLIILLIEEWIQEKMNRS